MNYLVLARGSILVLDAQFAQATGSRRYIGRNTISARELKDLPEGEPRHEQSNEFLEPGDKPVPHTAYPRKSTPESVPVDRYYTRALKNGELWPADKASADCAGVQFDPTFGGEYPSLKAAKSGKVGE